MRNRATVLLLGGSLLLGFAAAASAQQKYDPEQMAKRYEAKLKKEFLKKVSWEQHFDGALAKAKETGLPVLAYFSRSYAP